MRWLWLCACILAAALPSCQDDAARCTPGASLPCACTDGRAGAQLCTPQQTLGACVCSSPLPADAAGDGASDATPAPDGPVVTPDVTVSGDAAADDGSLVTPDVPGDASVVDERPADASSDAPPGDVSSGEDAVTPTDAGGADAGAPVTFSGGFVAGASATSDELTGHFSWGAAIYATGDGITLEGTFR